MSKLIENIDNPKVLENFYRTEPNLFKIELEKAIEEGIDSCILNTWVERISYKEEKTQDKKQIIIISIIGIISAVLTRVLVFLADKDIIPFINIIFGIVPFMIYYLSYSSNEVNKKNKYYTIILATLILIINILPDKNTDSGILAYIHMPIVLWFLVNYSYSKKTLSKVENGIEFLRFNGEYVILYTIMAISGVIITLITNGLFFMIGIDISEFYFENIVVMGASFFSIITILITINQLKYNKDIAPIVAKIFSPIMLITLISNVTFALLKDNNLFYDRDFLLLFNIVLILVLALTIYSIIERKKRSFFDYLSFLLVVISFVIDLLAIFSISFRLSEYGLTPNRLAILGINLIIMGNLTGIIYSYASLLRKRASFDQIKKIIINYLPIYGIWALFVILVFPLIFR